MDLRRRALSLLSERDCTLKADGTRALWLEQASLDVDTTTVIDEPPDVPGRPLRPRLVSPKLVPTRSPHTRNGRAALLHAVAHIEFNAINLALDACWRFAGMPDAYHRDWLRVAAEEALHFTLVRGHLNTLGHDYGDFDAHDGLWQMALKTRGDVVDRMALVPRVLEARGLDVTPGMQAKLREAGDPRAAEVLEVILRDEIGHVRIGNHWYHRLCRERGIDPAAHTRALIVATGAPRPRPPLNVEARTRAGLSAEDQAALAALPTTFATSDPNP
jgi:uncharacterized ferritin-like protein (DUF455 family)